MGGNLSRFEGMRLKLRRTAAGRYALGVDLELGVEAKTPGPSKPGRPDEDATEPGEEEDELAGEDGAAFTGASEDNEEEEDEAGFAAEEEDDDGQDAAYAAEGEDEAEDEDEDEDAFGAEDAEDAEDDADEGEERAPGGRWPNRMPVRKGILEISQASALFDDPDDDDDDDDDEQPASRAAGMSVRAQTGKPTPGTMSPAAKAVKKMLEVARKTIGMGERPPGSNRNPITSWYNKHIVRIGPGPWCNMAVTYWAGHSGNLRAIFAGPKIGYAYTVYHARKFKQKGRWRTGVAGIKPGDIVFFDWRGSRQIGNIDHVGIVERVKGKRIVTIEGNTTGDKCRRMVRDARYIVGYGRPAYGA